MNEAVTYEDGGCLVETCTTGFKVNSDKTACEQDTAQAAKTCSGLDAGVTITNGKYLKSDGDKHGSRATFSCDKGYELVLQDDGGQDIPNPITCDAPSADAAWPTPRPKCAGTARIVCLTKMMAVWRMLA